MQNFDRNGNGEAKIETLTFGLQQQQQDDVSPVTILKL